MSVYLDRKIKFRRNTHDKDGNYRETFGDMTAFEKHVWDNHGGICHMMSSSKPMSYDEILIEIRKDTTNYLYEPCDFDKFFYEGEMLPTPEKVALSLVRLIEAGLVEVVIDFKGVPV